MARIGLIDFDGKIVNLALAKLSAEHKRRGDTVIFNPVNPGQVDKVYCSVIFEKNREKALKLREIFPDITFGGSGYSLKVELPPEIESLRPDYDLYTADDIYKRMNGIMTKAKKLEKAQTIVNAGIGYLSRGCTNKCGFCLVPQKEGDLRRVANISDLINERSKNLILLDNNLTANPDCIEILKEIKERGLTVDITQGIDVRTMSVPVARALAGVKHLRSIHYAWDHPEHEDLVMRGIDTLSGFIGRSRHLCFTLIGYQSSFEQDEYRFRKLLEAKVDPYIMVYNRSTDIRLRHFARWVNGRFYRSCSFNEYGPWVRDKIAYFAGAAGEQLSLFGPNLAAA